MTTQVIIKSPSPNHQNVKVETVSETGVKTLHRVLTDGEETMLYVHGGNKFSSLRYLRSTIMANIEVMFDLETMSTRFDAAIVSIGACKWNSEGVHDTFYRAISLADSLSYGLHKDPDTVQWWKKQPLEAQLAWAQNGVPLKQALQDYINWLGDDGKNAGHYCWGLNFDIPILATSLEKCGLEKPWKYWNLRCARTIHAIFDTGKIAKREGVYHNAKDDAVTQATELIRILNQN